MSEGQRTIEIRLKTLTPLWTGGVKGICDRLHETGIIGNLRWWYEAIVRGLGGQACDPTKSVCQGREHCAACELFGCTGWRRKFCLDPAEKWLLAKTVEIACKYGAIGGKKTLKPQRNPSVGKDFGLLQLEKDIAHESVTSGEVREFCHDFEINGTPNWPNLQWFFFVSGHFLWRGQMNRLMGLDENGRPLPKRTQLQRLLGSTKAGTSKKLFSFKEGSSRVGGYVDDKIKLQEIKEQLKQFRIPERCISDGSQVLHSITEAR